MTPKEQIPSWATRYHPGDYPVFGYTGDTLAFSVSKTMDSVRVCVVVRGPDGPYAGMLAVPGGFVQWKGDGQGIDAAARELAEETGLRMNPSLLMAAEDLDEGSPDPEVARNPDSAAYIEELRTYDANGRDPRQWVGGNGVSGVRIVSKAHLAIFSHPPEVLSPEDGEDAVSARWQDVYDFLPWERLRPLDDKPQAAELVVERLRAWARSAKTPGLRHRRHDAIDRAFGADFADWNEERVPERFALIMQAGLLEEAHRNRWGEVSDAPPVQFGTPLAFDHRMMLADALGRLRSKIKYLPSALAALVPMDTFTMRDLQSVCEVVGGRPLYRQNFPRVIADSNAFRIVESTGERVPTGRRGPAAEVYRFPTDVHGVRLDPSIRMPWIPLADIDD